MWVRGALTPKQRETIQKRLSLGRESFVLRYGVLAWGIPVFLLTTAWDCYDRYRLHKPFESSYLILHLALALPVWIALGCWAGVLTWKRYNDLLETNQS